MSTNSKILELVNRIDAHTALTGTDGGTFHIDPNQPLYGYVPTRSVCYIFVILFSITTRASPCSCVRPLLTDMLGSPPLVPSCTLPSMVVDPDSGDSWCRGGRRVGGASEGQLRALCTHAIHHPVRVESRYR